MMPWVLEAGAGHVVGLERALLGAEVGGVHGQGLVLGTAGRGAGIPTWVQEAEDVADLVGHDALEVENARRGAVGCPRERRRVQVQVRVGYLPVAVRPELVENVGGGGGGGVETERGAPALADELDGHATVERGGDAG
jgi:hypothetical protein